MKAIFGNEEAIWNDETFEWNSDYQPLEEVLNIALYRAREAFDIPAMNTPCFAVQSARKAIPTLEILDDVVQV